MEQKNFYAIYERLCKEKGGWKTPHTMEKVYQHTFTEERREADNKMDLYFEKFMV